MAVTRNQRAQETIRRLREVIPRPATELEYGSEYELIVAVILSAQCTDERVNKVTPDFYRRFPDIQSLADAEEGEVYPIIRSVTYPNNKSRHLVAMARMIVEDFDGHVPSRLEDLMKLPGVGRKTAQVVAAVAFEANALPVDTHVFRVANRIGLADARTPVGVERQLKGVLPEVDWAEGHHLLILHGRYTCTARSPQCDRCAVSGVCRYYERLQKLPDPIQGLSADRGRYYCQTRRHYFDVPEPRKDRYGTEQISCPRCGSMNVFQTRTGISTRRVPDYRVS